MMLQQRQSSHLFAENVPYIEDLYESYLSDPASVPDEWRGYFRAVQTLPASGDADIARKQQALQALVAAYRMVGTRQADLDPLRWSPTPPLAELTPAWHGLGEADWQAPISTAGTYFSDAPMLPLKELATALHETYSGTLGAEFMYLADPTQRQWWQQHLEASRAKATLTAEQRRRILERLTAAEGLEKFLHTRYTGQKRFSLEGGESLIVLLDEAIRHGAVQGIQRMVLGMAHRGRLNVLVNTVGKPPHMLFDEFDGKTAFLLPAGDVKYHKGYSGSVATEHGDVEVQLAFNPSHLEIVNPVVQGMARAHAEQMDVLESGGVLPVEIHGDVAISGQGIVMETMNLSGTKGHGTGGTLHIVVNNQIGFTTSDPSETRSTFYCTDIAKLIEAPVLHVNGDDPEAVVAAVRLAIEYRMTFKRSVVIDLVCFRRHGHQEQDTPGITQPLMYRAVATHPGVRSMYAQKLVAEGLLSSADVAALGTAYRDYLSELPAAAAAEAQADAHAVAPPAATQAPSLEQLRALAQQLTVVPSSYALHPLVAKVIGSRQEMADGSRALDWGMGEHLAFASLLAQGVNVRLSGQDSERGTFSHRHAVLNNQNRTVRDEGKYTPLNHLSPEQGRFTVNNSILSEAAVLAFEYGYSSVRSDSLVIWEAQFGDFANGAQVVIDNFIAAAEAKWGQHNGVTLFLPHGQDGQGPEHASARLERYLQLCAQDNIQVCQPTTPAQMYHLLRRQALTVPRKPLVVMTPKSLLRHADAVSTLEELAEGRFQPVLGDEQADPAKVKKVIVSSGKVHIDLLDFRRSHQADEVALLRLEQLYPFPAAELSRELARYPHAVELVWAQEEARNQGAWKAIEEDLRAVMPVGVTLRDSSRAASPSTAPRNMALHLEQQTRLVSKAFGEQ